MPTSMFENLVVPQGSTQDVQRATQVLKDAKAGISEGLAVTKAVYQIINLLPDGDLKTWLLKDPVDFWKSVIALFRGKKYQTGQYILGERLIDQVQGGNVGRRDVPDDVVPVARMLFTILFGVRINNSEDLDSLDYGIDAYYQRPNKEDIPREAVERAVFLKQNFYPIRTYNVQKWDLSHFEQFPLVAPIPEMNAHATEEGLNVGKLYTGTVPGGAWAVDGVIPVDAQTILKQLPAGSEFDPTPEPTQPHETSAPQSFFDKIISFVKTNPVPAAAVATLLGILVYEISESE
jgi:hypothetical protein